eukprot:5951404-Pyramimonas_sp.AAC.1
MAVPPLGQGKACHGQGLLRQWRPGPRGGLVLRPSREEPPRVIERAPQARGECSKPDRTSPTIDLAS